MNSEEFADRIAEIFWRNFYISCGQEEIDFAKKQVAELANEFQSKKPRITQVQADLILKFLMDKPNVGIHGLKSQLEHIINIVEFINEKSGLNQQTEP